MPDSGRPRVVGPQRRGGDGDAEVFVADEQTLPVDLERWATLARDVLHEEGVRGNTELSLLFLSEEAIAELNLEFMGVNAPTDVLAFPIDAEVDMGGYPMPTSVGPDRSPIDPDDVPMLLGDVVVCPAVALRQAEEHAGTADDEIALLVVHGLLHVLGHDHAEPEERDVMQAKERALLAQFHWRGPVPQGFRQDHIAG